MLRRLCALTTLFSIYFFPSSVNANTNLNQLNYETNNIPEEAKLLSNESSQYLYLKKTAKNNPKESGFLKFLGILVLSFALIEIIDSEGSSSTTTPILNNPNLDGF